ncbi:MAG TPA: EamA family transporter [Rhodospirillaceae bacterium]|nr:EamA family transporter [Alphaproteobacteria bacterium]OUT42594.1 MAG: EamA family transporter [Micavibrio sp. TMED2]HCI45812.1 EamA family transporter [Rhodospirillaceae bacterium]MAS47290.1 EamA family transporter [Alphaproteobacteria bacterium]MAX95383.1 EamA family transporter [Alphaproteobacteria bacterium]
MDWRNWLSLIILSILWGGSFFFVEIAVRDLPTFTIVVCRVVLAALILNLVMVMQGQHMPNPATAAGRRIWAAFLVMGLINNAIPFSLIVWGQAHIASGVASILNATTPLFAVVVTHLMTSDERMTLPRLAGVILGIIGVAVLIGGTALQSLGVNVVAQLAVLGAAISYAFAGTFGRRFKTMGISPIATATGQVSASSLLMLPLVLAVDQPWTLAMPSTGTVLALIALAALSTALAYILYFHILASSGATNVLLVTFLVPVSAIMLGILFLNESLGTKHIIGIALIGAGLAAIDGRLLRLLKR